MDQLDNLVIGVRADTAGFARDVADIQGQLQGPLADGAARAGRAIDTALAKAIRNGSHRLRRPQEGRGIDARRNRRERDQGRSRVAVRRRRRRGGGGGLLGALGKAAASLFGGAPGRATGGPVTGGQAYMVGERGPELFVPTAAGRIAAAGGAPRGQHQHHGQRRRSARCLGGVHAAQRRADRALGPRRARSGERLMRHWLATPADQQRRDWLKRFDARFWTVDFPRPMMAAATTPAAQTVRVDLSFLRTNDLAGLIWESADRFDHPLLGYATNRDYRGIHLRFRWQAEGGVMPLDAVNGPTLTVEGRDATGTARSWYVRLWNYAVGTPTDAVITLDFDRWRAASCCRARPIRCSPATSTGCSFRSCRGRIPASRGRSRPPSMRR